MKVCLQVATHAERFANDLDCSGFVGKPVKLGDDIVGVVLRTWVEDGSLYADLDVSGEIERQIGGDS